MSKKRADILEKFLYLKCCKGIGKSSYSKVSDDMVDSLQSMGFNSLTEVERYLNETKKIKKQKANDSLYDWLTKLGADVSSLYIFCKYFFKNHLTFLKT